MREPIWDYRNGAHRDQFLDLLSPLIVASRTRDFATENLAKNQAVAWILSLKDVPMDVLEAGRDRLLARGVNFMPRPGELREACCDVVDERRAFAVTEADRIQAACLVCINSKGWQTVTVNGEEKQARCECWTRARAMLEASDAPLARPALPPAEPEPAA